MDDIEKQIDELMRLAPWVRVVSLHRDRDGWHVSLIIPVEDARTRTLFAVVKATAVEAISEAKRIIKSQLSKSAA